jgi:hypothetical protein
MNGEDLDNQSDADGDDIGDACDPSPQQYDGHQHEAVLADAVVIPETAIQGDVNCDELVTAVDALFILRDVAGLSAGACAEHGDVYCDGSRTSVDALGVLRFVAGLPVNQDEPCADIGTPL